MDTEGTYDARGTRGAGVPRPAGPPPQPPQPPPPLGAPATGPALGDWLRVQRPEAALGTWRYGHVPRPAEEPDRVPGRSLLSGALIAFLAMVLIWSLHRNQYFPFWLDPFYWTFPLVTLADSAVGRGIIENIIDLVVLVVFLGFFARLGRWAEVARRYLLPLFGALRPKEARRAPAVQAGSAADPAHWPDLRTAGQQALADRLGE
ncbi:ATP-binding protein, partial [Streptomyces sp. NPDC055078]